MADFSRTQIDHRPGVAESGSLAGRPPLLLTFNGTHNPDNLNGTDEPDQMRGFAGDDTIHGGGSGDEIDGGGAHDKLFGDGGDDSIFGGETGKDLLDGGSGHDRLHANNTHATLMGRGGDDTIVIEDSENFRLSAGAGADRVQISESLIPSDSLEELLDAGEGVDTLELGSGAVFAGRFQAETRHFEVLSGNVVGSENANDLDFQGATATGVINIFGNGGADEILGLDTADVISGGAHEDTLSGGGGNDSLLGGDARDFLAGGEGDDTMIGGGQTDQYEGDAGNDVLILSGAPGRAWGDDDDDLFILGICSIFDGVLLGGDGRDTLRFGGNSTFLGDFSARLQSIEVLDPDAAFVTFGGGTHVIDLSGVDLAAPHTGVNIQGDTQADRLTATAFNDTVVGHGGGDTIKGGAGNDTAFGGDGVDWMVDGVGDNVLNGEAGIDWLSLQPAMGGATVDLSISGFQDTGVGMSSFSGVENVLGGRFADTISGNDLANVFEGAAGGDTMTAGLGGDTFFWRLITHTSKADPDFLFGVGAGVTLSFQLVDADVTKAGNQAFKPVSVFHNKAGEATIVYDPVTNRTVISLDDDGDGKADGRVIMSGPVIDYEVIW